MASHTKDYSESSETYPGLDQPAAGSGRYTQDEQELLDHGKRKHRETTESAARAAQVGQHQPVS